MGLSQNIKVKIDTYCDSDKFSDPLPQISISPSLKSQNISGGACGIWSNQGMHECNYFDAQNNNACVSFGDTKKIQEHWRFGVQFYFSSLFGIKNKNRFKIISFIYKK